MGIVRISGDGNCLFAACAYFLPVCHHQVRRKVIHILEYHGDREIQGMSIRDWVKITDSPENYIENMKKEGAHGDGLCLSIISTTYQRTIRIYARSQKNPNEFTQITEYFSEYGNPITLYYTGDHYDVFLLD